MKFEDFEFVENLIIKEFPQWFKQNEILKENLEDKIKFMDAIVDRILPINRDLDGKMINFQKFKENQIKITNFLKENNIFHSIEDISIKNWTDFVVHSIILKNTWKFSWKKPKIS